MYTHRKVYSHFAKAIGRRALIVHYGRAPENLHPGPVDDMVNAYRWLLNQGIAPSHVALQARLAITRSCGARARH